MVSKLRLVFTITIAFLSFYGSAQNDYWQAEVSENVLDKNFSERFGIAAGRQFSFDEKLFKKEILDVSVAKKNSKIIYFPNEHGGLSAFQVQESPVFSPALAAKYPNIKSYSGHAVGGSNDKIRFSVSHNGIQSMIIHANQRKTTFMQRDQGDRYVLYSRDPNANRNSGFICSTKANISNTTLGAAQKVIDGQQLRKFRLAISATGDYTSYHGGTVADALAAINATVTRLNEVFETDLGVTFELVANNDQIIYTDASTDPYTTNLSNQTQNTLTTVIGESNYDVGHLFNQNDSGLDGNAGFIGSVCMNNRKGSGYSTFPAPEGDGYDIDLVAHELGHQFGANHTWSYETEGTAVQVEPGSGTTVMGYAGITDINDVASNSDAYFHYVSIVQIADYLDTVDCAEVIDLTNNPPTIIPAGSFIIPKSTAFVLTGSATDVDVDDVLTYTWEQTDNGIVPQSTFGPNNTFGANFRSLKPTTSPERYFPKLSSVVAGQLTESSPTITSPWETVSDVERELNFALTVRDNAIGGGQVVSDLVNVFVENSAGPFAVTSHAAAMVTSAGSVETITWDVANTNLPPINAQTVDLLLSTDGGLTFPIILAENVENDGSHDIVVPGNSTTAARIMIKASENIFYAVNATAFTIDPSEIVLNFEKIEQEVCQGDVLVVPFSYETFDGFNEEATFSIATPPDGVDIVIFPETAIDNGTLIEITFTNTENLDTGTYPIRVLATTASTVKEVTIDLNVYNATFVTTTLVAPADGIIDLPTSMLLEWEADFLATSYDVEIASDIAFTSVIESATVLGEVYSPVDLQNQTQYFWRVKPINSCGEGTFGAPFSFTTIDFNCINVDSEGLPLTISASGTPTVIAEVILYDDLPIADINVNLALEHSYLADLTVTLTSPAGTSIILFSNSCDDFRNVAATFDDSAPAFVCNPVAPGIRDTVKPLGFLSSFNGESTFGTWVLTVSDNAPADGGVLTSFSLDVCAEGEFRPDADGDGVFDDGADLCLGTPADTPVNASGCPVLVFSASNFRVEGQSESCRSSNDGAITIQVEEALDYTIVVTGSANSTDTFTAPSYSLNDLMAGTYSLCITATNGTIDYLEQCFEVVITEPEILSVSSKASLDGSVVDLELEGATLYNIELNGVVTQTEDAQFTLNLKEGGNTLKVSSNLPCQGVYEEEFFFSTQPIVYPNPTFDLLTVSFGATIESVKIRIFSANGSFIKSQEYSVNGSQLELDLSALATGLYFIKFESENIKGTSKVIKK